MVMAPDRLADNPRPLATPGERLHAARYVLAAAATALLGTAAAWDVPWVFALAASAAIAGIAAFVPRRSVLPWSEAELTESAPPPPDAVAAATLDALPRAAFLLDIEGAVRFANRRAAELFPATRAGDPLTFTFRRPEIAEALRQAAAGQAGAIDYREPGETAAAYSALFSPVVPAGGQAEFILLVFEDVSDRLAVARLRSDFVANASHELRTPLASLIGFIETLQGPARNDPKATERFLGIMLDQARRMRRLLDDLLSLSRAELKAHRRPTETIELSGVLNHVRDALAPLAAEHGVVLHVDTPVERIEVAGDRDEIIQVFQNLYENGIRYGAAGGRIEISLERPDAAPHVVRVHVQDFGPGIAPEHLPRLTERFYRVDVGASRERKGTGLGLAIVKHILTRHQGQLDIESRPGEGACFTVTFPLHRP